MIDKLNPHYSMTNPASIYDEEALTALELAGRTAEKLNAVIGDQNALRSETETRLTDMEEKQIPAEVKEEIQDQIDNGTFDDAINHYTGDLKDRLNNLEANLDPGSTTSDAELVDIRLDARGKTHPTAGESVRYTFRQLPLPNGGMYTGNFNLNQKTDPGTYLLGSGATFTNIPEGFDTASGFLIVEGFGDRETVSVAGMVYELHPFGKQTIYNNDMRKSYTRKFSLNRSAIAYADMWEFTPWIPSDFTNTFRIIENAVDVNGIVEGDRYIFSNTNCTNAPFKDYGFILFVNKASSGWIVQHAYGLHNNPCHFFRVGLCTSESQVNFASDMVITWSDWKQTVTTDMTFHQDITTAGADINKIVEEKTYTIAITDDKNGPPIANGYMLDVVNFSAGWLLQIAYPIYPNAEIYFRTGQNTNTNIKTNFASGLSVNWSAWDKVVTEKTITDLVKPIVAPLVASAVKEETASLDITKSNEGDAVLLFGDSIFANEQGETGIARMIEKLTGAKVFNFAFGGTRAQKRDPVGYGSGWECFDLGGICDLVNENGSFVDSASALYGSIPRDAPSYFSTTISNLVNFCNDALQMSGNSYRRVFLVFHYGYNDWYNGGEYYQSDMDETWNFNAQNYTRIFQQFVDLFTEYVESKATPILCEPFICGFEVSTSYDISFDFNDEDQFINAEGETLENYREALSTASKNMHCPIVKLGSECAVTEYSAYNYFNDDGVHPSEKGREVIARMIADTLRRM